MNIGLSEAELRRLAGVQRIHVVFKTHFDLGFTDFAAHVVDRYVGTFLPRAMDAARRSREGGQQRFVWTVGSWLVYECLEHGSPRFRAELERAIADGDITWTAAPFTPHSELMGRDLFVLGLSLSKRLDERFGTSTIAANFTDVPGHTLGIVPLLAREGVRFLHVGVNPASAVPDVPDAFRWRLASESAEIAVSYNRDYGGLTRFGASPDALLIVFTDDNVGPPEAVDVARLYAELEQRVPGVHVDAAGMNAFAAASLEWVAELPVVEREIGDSWIHGGATDPAKLAAYRELGRLRSEWVASGLASEAELDDAYRMLMLVGEHTWGLDVKTYVTDETAYGKREFIGAARSGEFATLAASWSEQREYVARAVALLPDRLAEIARDRLESLSAAPPDDVPPERVEGETRFENRRFELSLDPVSGAISHLVDKKNRAVYAAPSSALALARYQTFDADDYARFHREYLRSHDAWALKDFGKPGLETLGTTSTTWTPKVATVQSRRTTEATLVRCESRFSPVCGLEYGAPRRLVLDLALHDTAPRIDLSLSWFDKDPVRIPEALWLTFQLPAGQAAAWVLDKLGVPISPLEVVPRGGRMHAVERGVHYADERRNLTIEMLDAPVVSPLGAQLLRFDERMPEDSDGMAVCLFNNVWGTNFPMWYGESGRARFVLRFDDDESWRRRD